MKKTKVTIIAAIVVVLVIVVAAIWAGNDKKHKSPPEGQRVSGLSFDNLDLSRDTGVSIDILFEGEDSIIFCNGFGLWGYDLTSRSISFDVDLVKVFGEEHLLQGSGNPYSVWLESSADGNTIIMSCADRNASGDPEVERKTIFIDVPTLTYREGEYLRLEDAFSTESAKGYVLPGGTLRGSVYIRGEERYNLFESYE